MNRLEPKPRDAHVFVCHGSRCTNGGAPKIRALLAKALRGAGLKARVTRTGCQGLCKQGPVVFVESDRPRTWGGVREADVPKLARRIVKRTRVPAPAGPAD